jgi:hypothetical protein
LTKFIGVIVEHLTKVRAAFRKDSAREILDNYDFPELLQCLTVFDDFVKWTDGRRAVIAGLRDQAVIPFYRLEEIGPLVTLTPARS